MHCLKNYYKICSTRLHWASTISRKPTKLCLSLQLLTTSMVIALKMTLNITNKIYFVIIHAFPDGNDWLRHDSFFCNEVLGTERGKPFPTRRNATNDGVYFVGSIIHNPSWVVELFNSSTTKPNITFSGVTSKWTGNPNFYEDEPCHV